MTVQLERHFREGDRIADRFEICGCLGLGGHGYVYRVRDTMLGGAELAVKVLHPELRDEPSIVTRLRSEPLISREISSPRLGQVFEFFRTKDGHCFVTMELIEGTSLRTLIDSAPNGLPQNEAIRLLGSILEGVDALHRNGFIHRDLKPENVIVCATGDVKLIDLGLAQPIAQSDDRHTEAHDEASRQNLAELCIGTPYYTSPELVRGAPLDSRTDLYSAGLIAFELLTGRRPFTGKSEAELLGKQVRQPLPELPATVNPDISRLVASLAAKDPSRRPSSATEALARLHSAATRATTPTVRDHAHRAFRSRLVRRAAGIAVLFAILQGAAALIRMQRDVGTYAAVPFLLIEKLTGVYFGAAIQFLGTDVCLSEQCYTEALIRGDEHAFNVYTYLGRDPNVPVPLLRTNGSESTIFWAVKFERPIIERLVALGIKLDQTDVLGNTPLTLAAQMKKPDLVSLLAVSQELIEWRDADGMTALCHSFAVGDFQSAIILIRRGARSDVMDRRGVPCVHSLAHHAAEHPDLVDSMLLLAKEGKVRFDLPDAQGVTPLHIMAARGGDALIARLIDEAGVKDSADDRGRTAIFHAAEAGNREALRILADRSPTLDLAGPDGVPLAFFVVDAYLRDELRLKFVLKLLEQGLPAHSVHPVGGRTLLHVAAAKGDRDLYRALIAYGADPELKDTRGETARALFERITAQAPDSAEGDE